jgi:hypothetical protein
VTEKTAKEHAEAMNEASEEWRRRVASVDYPKVDYPKRTEVLAEAMKEMGDPEWSGDETSYYVVTLERGKRR